MKARDRSPRSNRLYVGVDIGGTNIQASLVEEAGLILCREKASTPRDAGAEAIIALIEKAIEDLIETAGISPDALTAIGIAVPGVVDPDQGFIAITPNTSLSGVSLGPHLEEKFNIPIILGNDGNLGALGETWLGSARKSKSTVYICVGTGIGSGLVLRRKLWRGIRESAGEIGHMIMQFGGPKCGCGNHGCLEALASRTAMERDMRAAVSAGRKSILTDLAGAELTLIRSGMIRKALDAKDELTTEIINRAAEVLGCACLNVRHLIDPEAIVLGGGVIEACSNYILPIIEGIIAQDPLVGARSGGKILVSALGDDAVVLGAVAAARSAVGRNPFKKRYRIQPSYPPITDYADGEITVAKKTFNRDIYIPVNGKVKKRDQSLAQETAGFPHVVGLKELELVCRGGPALLVIGAGKPRHLELTEDAKGYLAQRSIKVEILTTPKAVQYYNKAKQRKAALIHVTCTGERPT
jgi:glucokinase